MDPGLFLLGAATLTKSNRKSLVLEGFSLFLFYFFFFSFLNVAGASLILAENDIFPLTGTLRKNVLVCQAIYCFKYSPWTPCAYQVQRTAQST